LWEDRAVVEGRGCHGGRKAASNRHLHRLDLDLDSAPPHGDWVPLMPAKIRLAMISDLRKSARNMATSALAKRKIRSVMRGIHQVTGKMKKGMASSVKAGRSGSIR
jgi:hypothetical protein